MKRREELKRNALSDTQHTQNSLYKLEKILPLVIQLDDLGYS
jgi:hypothetical protein